MSLLSEVEGLEIKEIRMVLETLVENLTEELHFRNEDDNEVLQINKAIENIEKAKRSLQGVGE